MSKSSLWNYEIVGIAKAEADVKVVGNVSTLRSKAGLNPSLIAVREATYIISIRPSWASLPNV